MKNRPKQKHAIDSKTWLELHRSRQLRFVFVLVIIIAYIPLFPWVHQHFDELAFALTMIIPILAGWLLGMRGGLYLSILNALASLHLGFLIGESPQKMISTGIPAGIIMVILGTGIGRLRDLHKKIEIELLQRKKAEDELKKVHDELEDRVRKRTLELEQTNNRLRIEIMERKQAEIEARRMEVQLLRAKKMEAIGTLAGGVAHDLNNILGGLSSYPELLLMEVPENSPLKKPLLIIQKSGEKASAIVEDLLTLARRGLVFS